MMEEMSQAEVGRLLRGEHVPKKRRPQTNLESLTIELPLPGPGCSPNSRGHWSKRHRSQKLLREAAWAIAAYELSKCGIQHPPMWLKATAEATFHRPGKLAKLSDPDNLVSSLKAAFDGLQDAGLIANDVGLTHLPPKQLIGSEATERKVVLIITRIE